MFDFDPPKIEDGRSCGAVILRQIRAFVAEQNNELFPSCRILHPGHVVTWLHRS